MTIVTYYAPMGTITIPRRLAVLQRDLDKRRKTWPADKGDDFRRWACARVGDMLRHMADNLDCSVSNPEIGHATG